MSDGHQTTHERQGWELAESLLKYFDSYRLGSVSPIAAEIESALKREWQAGWDAGARVASRSALAHYEDGQQ